MHKSFFLRLLVAPLCTQMLLAAAEHTPPPTPPSGTRGGANYDETMKTVSELIVRQDFPRAIALLNELEPNYPNNGDLLSRRAALYYWTQSYPAAIHDYEKLYMITKDPRYQEEIRKVMEAEMALKCREKKNFVSLQKEVYSYKGKQPVERDTTVQAGIKTGDTTWIGSAASIDRYDTIDRQFGLEIYSSLGQKEERRWGYVAFYQSPAPSFLPQWDLSGAIYQGIFEQSEISLGYRHMSFRNKGVDIVKPGISVPLPINAFRASEELYLVPDTDSYSFVTTLSYDPSCRLHGFYSFTAGNSAETFRDENDIRRVKTRSHTVGATWRFDPSWALGAEATDGRRSQLYQRTGGKIVLKYFW